MKLCLPYILRIELLRFHPRSHYVKYIYLCIPLQTNNKKLISHYFVFTELLKYHIDFAKNTNDIVNITIDVLILNTVFLPFAEY
jgi:hypothetical protein